MNVSGVKQALAALPAVAVAETEHAKRGNHLDVTVAPDQVVAAATILDGHGFFIEAITGVDWLGEKAAAEKAAKAAAAAAAAAAPKAAEAGEPPPAASAPVPAIPAEDQFEVIYDFNHYETLCRVTVRTRVARDNPEVPTISDIYSGANWHERETHDFFGITFVGHPYLVPLLLPEDADFHPLRKDFKP